MVFTDLVVSNGRNISGAPLIERAILPTSDVFIGTGCAFPKRSVSNSELALLVDTTDEWIVDRVGVRSRFVAGPGESTAQLGYQAALKALADASTLPNEIDLLVVATETPDDLLPSSASLIQQLLGASGAMAFDVRAACSGFLFALTIAHGLQRSHGFKKALIVGSETLSRMIDWRDRTTCVLFGDGAGAVVLRANDDSSGKSGIIASDLHTDGAKRDFIRRPGGAFPPATISPSICSLPVDEASPYVQMQGREVFKTAILSMAASVESVLQKSGFTIDDVDLFIPHQSNKRIIDGVCDKVQLTDENRVVVNIDRVANTSAASIPIALDEALRAGRIKKGDLVLLTAVGAGMTYGSVLIRW